MDENIDRNDARRKIWQPYPRPDWVAKINQEGSYMDIKGVVPLDENSLLETAKANTGLHDFGQDDWHEPFQVLVHALDNESQLNLMGRLLTRSDLLMFLQARLRIEDTYKQHPEIEDEEIIKPLLLMGQPRTGTSALQNLLAEDPDNRSLRTWEVCFPCPPPEAATYDTDPRIGIADRLVTMQNRVTPEVESIHEMNGWIPTETLFLDCLSFINPAWFSLFGEIPSYVEHTAKMDFKTCYRYQKRVLKLLQWKKPGETWILKTPDYVRHLPDVLQVYPDACLVWIHRDPIKAFTSGVNTLGAFLWMRTDHPFHTGSLDFIQDPENIGEYLSKPIQWIDDGTIRKDRLCNIHYHDFIQNPVSVARHVYRFFGLERNEDMFARMQAYVVEHPRTERPAHKYNGGIKEKTPVERNAFKKYQTYFNVPNEM